MSSESEGEDGSEELPKANQQFAKPKRITI